MSHPVSDRSTSPAATSSSAAVVRTTIRVSAAALVLAGGFIHLRLWQQVYKDLPAAVPGRWVVRTGFPVNAAMSLLLAAALIAVGLPVLARLHRLVVVAALGLEVASIAMLVTTRSRAVFDWIERDDWGTGPKRTITVEVLAVVALLAVLVFERVRPDEDHPVANTP